MKKIGFTSCFFHADPQRAIFKGKTLLYMEQQMVEWLSERGIYIVLIPNLGKSSKIQLQHYVNELDGLLLQGGSDVSPQSYGETAIDPNWQGDYIRDQYEIELIQQFSKQDKPILGICRGLQILNVAFGGTLYQDINTQVEDSLVHRNWDIYDQNFHELEILPDSKLANLYSNKLNHVTNSVHHQSIKDLASDFIVEAISPKDGVIEAIRHEYKPHISAVQWHPEFQNKKDTHLISPAPILDNFISYL